MGRHVSLHISQNMAQWGAMCHFTKQASIIDLMKFAIFQVHVIMSSVSVMFAGMDPGVEN